VKIRGIVTDAALTDLCQPEASRNSLPLFDSGGK
jgi:hypothetical protein